MPASKKMPAEAHTILQETCMHTDLTPHRTEKSKKKIVTMIFVSKEGSTENRENWIFPCGKEETHPLMLLENCLCSPTSTVIKSACINVVPYF